MIIEGMCNRSLEVKDAGEVKEENVSVPAANQVVCYDIL
jgi:hypothetical protein